MFSDAERPGDVRAVPRVAVCLMSDSKYVVPMAEIVDSPREHAGTLLPGMYGSLEPARHDPGTTVPRAISRLFHGVTGIKRTRGNNLVPLSICSFTRAARQPRTSNTPRQG